MYGGPPTRISARAAAPADHGDQQRREREREPRARRCALRSRDVAGHGPAAAFVAGHVARRALARARDVAAHAVDAEPARALARVGALHAGDLLLHARLRVAVVSVGAIGVGGAVAGAAGHAAE